MGQFAHQAPARPPGVITCTVLGRQWRLTRTADLETLWDQIGLDDLDQDERLPYWVELWPASLALCQWLGEHRRRLAGRRVVDLGCGLGLTALAAASLGGRVLGLDYEPEALRHAVANARGNAVAGAAFACMDWRAPALRPGCADLVVAGDVMYEKRFAAPVADFLDHALARDGLAWVAEPNRSVYGHFQETLAGRGWRMERLRTVGAPQDGRTVTVNIWEIARPGA
ncbi:MAG: methyltransferase domain-containing protein [Thermodesulfobacteriota bacterium]